MKQKKKQKPVTAPKGRLTESMQTQVDRLLANEQTLNTLHAMALEQFNQFVAYCRTALNCPPDWRLHYQEKIFLPPTDPRFGTRIPEKVKVVR